MPSQVEEIGLNANNYFAYLDGNFSLQGGGTPVFTLLSSTSSTPEPASFSLFSIAAIAAGLIGRKRLDPLAAKQTPANRDGHSERKLSEQTGQLSNRVLSVPAFCVPHI